MKNVINKALLIVILSAAYTYSQITIQIGGGLGAVSPTGNYSGTTIDFYNGTQYGLGTGFNMHAKARAGLLGFNLFGMIDYTTLNSGEGEGEPGKGKVENSHNIFSLKAGPEFNISIPLSPLGFYLNGFVSVNTISGKVSFRDLTDVPDGDYDIGSATRFGVGAGGGVLVDILPVVTLDFGIHYNAYNLFGKQYTTNVTSYERLDAYTSLNDDKDPLFNTTGDRIISESRPMNAWQVTLTAMIGL